MGAIILPLIQTKTQLLNRCMNRLDILMGATKWLLKIINHFTNLTAYRAFTENIRAEKGDYSLSFIYIYFFLLASLPIERKRQGCQKGCNGIWKSEKQYWEIRIDKALIRETPEKHTASSTDDSRYECFNGKHQQR